MRKTAIFLAAALWAGSVIAAVSLAPKTSKGAKPGKPITATGVLTDDKANDNKVTIRFHTDVERHRIEAMQVLPGKPSRKVPATKKEEQRDIDCLPWPGTAHNAHSLR